MPGRQPAAALSTLHFRFEPLGANKRREHTEYAQKDQRDAIRVQVALRSRDQEMHKRLPLTLCLVEIEISGWRGEQTGKSAANASGPCSTDAYCSRTGVECAGCTETAAQLR